MATHKQVFSIVLAGDFGTIFSFICLLKVEKNPQHVLDISAPSPSGLRYVLAFVYFFFAGYQNIGKLVDMIEFSDGRFYFCFTGEKGERA